MVMPGPCLGDQGHGNAGHDPETVRAKNASVARPIRTSLHRCGAPSHIESRLRRAAPHAASGDRLYRRLHGARGPRACGARPDARRHPVRGRDRNRARAHADARGAAACRTAGGDQRVARGARPRQCAASRRAAGDRRVAGGRRRPGYFGRRLAHHAYAAGAPRARLRHLAGARESACHGGRGRRVARGGQGLFADAHDPAAAPRRSRRPRHRRARGLAHQGPDRHEKRARRTCRRSPAIAP